MSIELKPCPHCGQELTLNIVLLHPGLPLLAHPAYRVECSWYRGGCGAAAGARESKEAAAKAWNARTGK